MAKSPIVGAFSKSRSGNLADSDLYNLIVEIVETKDGKTAGALYNTAGLDLIGTLGSGPVRGAGVLNGVLYVVSGPSVYSLTPNGLATLCGGVGGGSSPVSMFQNTLQLMIVNGMRVISLSALISQPETPLRRVKASTILNTTSSRVAWIARHRLPRDRRAEFLGNVIHRCTHRCRLKRCGPH